MSLFPSTLTKSLKAATLAATTLATACMPGMITAAEAKPGHGGHHGHHRHHFHRHIGFYAPAYVSYGYGGCGWLKARAVSTGSRYWWNRYHACRGD